MRLWHGTYYSFFFFQAEGGIRDHCVTGVQTCALPIYHAGIATQIVVERQLEEEGRTRHDLGREKFIERVWRSEERRVGKECSWRWVAYAGRKKDKEIRNRHTGRDSKSQTRERDSSMRS